MVAFSKRMVFVYSCICLFPFAVFCVLVICGNFFHQTRLLHLDAERRVAENMAHVRSSSEVMHSMETMILSDNDLMLFLLSSGTYSVGDSIEFAKSKVQYLEHVMPVAGLYAIRIFCDDSIAECWPVFLHESRADVSVLPYWSFGYRASYMGSQTGLKLPSACMTRKLTRNRREAGWLQVAVRMDDFFPFLYGKANDFEDDLVFAVSRSDGEEIWEQIAPSESAMLEAEDVASLMALCAGKGGKPDGTVPMARLRSGLHVVSWDFVPELGIVLLHTSSLRAVMRQSFMVLFSMLVVLMLSVFLVVQIVHRVTYRLHRGVFSLMDGMEQVHGGDLSVQIPVSGTDEVSRAQTVFNSMTARLQSQIEQIKREQQLIAETEMKAMQNQINAHFLYNVLETIRMQAVVADADSVAQSILVLGKMMRYCLRWRIHEVTLSEELEYVQSYIYILNMRNDYTITLRTDVPEQWLGVRVPKMTLQPLVENSFFYAIEPFARDSEVRVFVRPDAASGRLWVCVQDFGPGMRSEQLQGLLSYLEESKEEREGTGHIGMKSIQSRLFLFYGSDFKIRIESEPDAGMTVFVPLPIGGES